MRSLVKLALALVVVSAAAGAAGWLALYYYLQEPGPLREELVLELPRGSGVMGIARQLAEADVIRWPLAFAGAARLEGRDRSLRAGEFRFTPGMSPAEVLALLESGKIVLHRITVPEGLTVAETYALLEASEVLTGELPAQPPEGSLLPETYMVPRGEPRVAIVERMRAAMKTALEEAWAGRQEDLPLEGPQQALILASVIEKETAVAAEYPLVAAVFVNRLRRGMRLQTDPTVIYALTEGEGPLGRPLTRADLETDHPYNTYKNGGLPPGPIASPGRGALAAAVNPADVDFLYFVADGSGGHAFARTLREHNRNVARWRRVRDAAQ
ncbi:endolytic transglycosylase MltG [Marinimicrococcus flavescens]|uniref:Endolytic murein transglycosylase n=1 Tax=Marinimicrococcus flavescens TaxID=3031815 RepID=A0AAP3V0S1_9PROT|nr:endolytic transglycosylase MltG [Marinimicrococcus flavescens]